MTFLLKFLKTEEAVSLHTVAVIQRLSRVQPFCNPEDHSPSGSSVHQISQARILEWIAIAFSRGLFLNQGSNPHLLRWQANYLPLNHLGRPPYTLHTQ